MLAPTANVLGVRPDQSARTFPPRNETDRDDVQVAELGKFIYQTEQTEGRACCSPRQSRVFIVAEREQDEDKRQGLHQHLRHEGLPTENLQGTENKKNVCPKTLISIEKPPPDQLQNGE